MRDRDFLMWLHERLELVHGEDRLVDYMHKLRGLIRATPEKRETVERRGSNSLSELKAQLEGDPVTADVICWRGITKLDLPPDRILDVARDAGLKAVVVMGYREEDGEFYFASSYADGGAVLWLLEKSKLALLNVEVPA